MEFEIEGTLPVYTGDETSTGVDRTRTNAVEAALEERIVAMLAELGTEILTHEDRTEMARCVGLLFGCWRSMQPELDGTTQPFDMIREAIVEGRRKKSESDDPGEGEDQGDDGDAG